MFELMKTFNLAYLDPGTGSLIIQSLIGVIAGVSVFGRNAIHGVAVKTRRLFNRNSKAEAKPESK